MILPPTKRRLMNALMKKVQQKYGSGIGAHYEKQFIKHSIEDLESSLEFDDGRDTMEYIIGIKVRKIGKIYF